MVSRIPNSEFLINLGLYLATGAYPQFWKSGFLDPQFWSNFVTIITIIKACMKLFQHPKFQNPKDCLAIKTIIVSNQIVLTKKSPLLQLFQSKFYWQSRRYPNPSRIQIGIQARKETASAKIRKDIKDWY